MSGNIDELDERGNITNHIGPSTEWRKVYDLQGREIEYHRIDGQSAYTTYDDDGVASVEWVPPIVVA